MRLRTIRHAMTLQTDSSEVYNTLIDSKKLSKFTDGKARMTKAVGGKFTLFDGYINGKILQFVPGEKIAQSWQADEKSWPKSHFSEAVYTLRKVKGGTRVNFVQKGVPEDCYEHISKAWDDYYWTPLRKMLDKEK